jgi:hypothetical protein
VWHEPLACENHSRGRLCHTSSAVLRTIEKAAGGLFQQPHSHLFYPHVIDTICTDTSILREETLVLFHAHGNGARTGRCRARPSKDVAALTPRS